MTNEKCSAEKTKCWPAVEPDAWWGEDGIDVLLWADGIPYVFPEPLGESDDESPDSAGDDQ